MFTHHFEYAYPLREREAPERVATTPSGQHSDREPEDYSVLDEVIDAAKEVVSANEQFAVLPKRNQQLLLDMASLMVYHANRIRQSDGWKKNYWGLYIVGSRARGDAVPDSDLDLLSVGTFYRDQGFAGASGPVEAIFKGFDIEEPDELPSEYNVGFVERKYMVQATPHDQGVLPVDMSVVDLTFMRATLHDFKRTMDVDPLRGTPLPRVPLVELSVAEDPFCAMF